MSNTHTIHALDEDVLKAFIWSVYNFFTICTKVEPEINTPYLFDDDLKHSDFTGTIGVSGNHKGAIYFSIETPLLETLLKDQYAKNFSGGFPEGVDNIDRADFAGEITNIISGNVRNYLGEEFLISVPVVMSEPGTSIHLPMKGCGIVFPINWNGYICHLILNFEVEQQEVKKILEAL